MGRERAQSSFPFLFIGILFLENFVSTYKHSLYKYLYGVLCLLSAVATMYFSVYQEMLNSILSAILTVAFYELTKIYNSFEKFINEE